MADFNAITLQLKGIRKAYNIGLPAETEVLHGLDLTIERGEFVALIGPSGSGKSTLLNLIGLLDKPTAGELLITGQPTTQLQDRELTLVTRQSDWFCVPVPQSVARIYRVGKRDVAVAGGTGSTR